MILFDRQRKKRLRDFASRVSSGGRKLQSKGEIVCVHPLADETDLLDKLGITPADCTSVDGYWAVDGDVVFLQVNSTSADPIREPGFYGRIASYPPHHINLVVVTEVPQITGDVLEQAVRGLLSVGWRRKELKDALVPLGNVLDFMH